MRYIIALCVITAGVLTHADLIHSPINESMYILPENVGSFPQYPRPASSKTVELDLNLDSAEDVILKYNFDLYASVSCFYLECSSNTWVINCGYDVVPLSVGTAICGEAGEENAWTSGGFLGFSDYFYGMMDGRFFETNAFVGLAVQETDGIHYGWIRIENTKDWWASGIIIDSAYETEPGKAIVTGVVPEPDILAFIILGAVLCIKESRFGKFVLWVG